eukprot:994200-Prymnesium_polylepis.1
MTTAGDVTDYNSALLDEMSVLLAAQASVPTTTVTMTAHAGSAVLTAKIVTASSATTLAVQNSLSGALSSPSAATAFFASVSGGGVTVIATPTVSTITESLVANGDAGMCPTCGCHLEGSTWVLD